MKNTSRTKLIFIVVISVLLSVQLIISCYISSRYNPNVILIAFIIFANLIYHGIRFFKNIFLNIEVMLNIAIMSTIFSVGFALFVMIRAEINIYVLIIITIWTIISFIILIICVVNKDICINYACKIANKRYKTQYKYYKTISVNGKEYYILESIGLNKEKIEIDRYGNELEYPDEDFSQNKYNFDEYEEPIDIYIQISKMKQ